MLTSLRRRCAAALVVAALTLTAIAVPGSASTGRPDEPHSAVERGGSNFSWYQVDGCDREPYATISSFHTAEPQVREALAQLYGAGQRRLRIGIFHWDEPTSGTVMSSAGGNLSQQNRENLTGFLTAIKQAGFAEIEVAFHPVGANDPHGWSGFEPFYYQQNRDLIANLRGLIAASGIPYRIDLLNEGMPMTTEPVLADYASRLWRDYVARFGKDDTVGFSMTVWLANRAEMIRQVYGDVVPDVFDVHLYGDGHNGDEYEQFVAAHNVMAENGHNQAWIIGEVYYNDGAAAGHLLRAIEDTGRAVLYLTQWPLTRRRGCDHVDVAPPIDFSTYRDAGF